MIFDEIFGIRNDYVFLMHIQAFTLGKFIYGADVENTKKITFTI